MAISTANLSFRVDHGERLVVTIMGMDMDDFLVSAVWKARLYGANREGFRPQVEGQDLVYSSELAASQCRHIVECFQKLERRGIQTICLPGYLSFIAEADTHVAERASAGMAIKTEDPSVLDEFRAFRSVIDGAMERRLRDKQAWDAFYMASMQKSANFSVPGSGKTAAVLGAFAFLRDRGLAHRVLVISPKNAFKSWEDEWTASFGGLLSCRPLSFHEGAFRQMTSVQKRHELELNAGRYNLIMVNYEACSNFEKQLADIADSDTLLVFDEVHKVKRIGGIRASSALAIARDAKFVAALTGTPIPNSYSDIYNLLHILYPHDYDDFFGFSKATLASPNPMDVERINRVVQPFFCRTNKNMLDVPRANGDSIIRVEATSEENELLELLLAALRSNSLALIVRIMQVESDPRALYGIPALDEIGGLYDGDLPPGLNLGEALAETSSAGALISNAIPTSKMSACVELVDDLVAEGKSVIVWCVFIRSIEGVAEQLGQRGLSVGVITGATDFEERAAILDDFRAKNIGVLITNPHTLAESVSLHSVCHDAVYFEYSYNLIHLLQSKDRIHRLGLPEGQYTQYHFLQTGFIVDGRPWSLDENIYNRLMEKEQTMLEAIDRGVLEPGSVDEDDLEIVFRGLFSPTYDGKVASPDNAVDCQRNA
ncbi:DEAD/DEAH box helicase [uncultured Parolsenella sp.]|uniref:DEAD/DEAH box helicase n=1 Tax=uncultured Parolsenella sp. TaxID=2083008 RepID=UPI0025EE1519|nr:DEAD/DEAH box helicase [uncultured Parolsenella sp.]